MSLDPTNAKISKLQRMIVMPSVELECRQTASYAFLANTITELEAENVSLSEQFEIVQKLSNELVHTALYQRYESVVLKNTGFSKLLSFSIHSDSLSSDYTYVAPTTCAVERGFSHLKHVINDR